MSIASDADPQRSRRAGRDVAGTVRGGPVAVLRPLSGRGAGRATHEEPSVLMAAL